MTNKKQIAIGAAERKMLFSQLLVSFVIPNASFRVAGFSLPVHRISESNSRHMPLSTFSIKRINETDKTLLDKEHCQTGRGQEGYDRTERFFEKRKKN